MNRKLFYLALFLVMTLLSCAKNHNKEQLFNEIYQNCDMNTQIKLSFQKIQFGNTINVNVYIQNLSKEEYIFSLSSNLEMWRFTKRSWEIVPSEMNITNLGADELHTDGNNFTVVPINPSATNNDVVRVVVTGKLYENGVLNNKCIGAFADYRVEP